VCNAWEPAGHVSAYGCQPHAGSSTTLGRAPVTSEPTKDRFHRLFSDTERELLAYLLRRVDRSEDAADVLAETFLVAWRRIDTVPEGDDGRLWLYGVARRQLANQRRGELRRTRLANRLRAELPVAVASACGAEDHRVAAVRAALARLEEEDREILRLSSWEGLAPSEIATVMGLPGVTVRSRLHRARKRLRTEVLQLDAAAPATASPTLAPKGAR
jgi:RNA polymerase sigma factor (sigma-70 family)